MAALPALTPLTCLTKLAADNFRPTEPNALEAAEDRRRSACSDGRADSMSPWPEWTRELRLEGRLEVMMPLGPWMESVRARLSSLLLVAAEVELVISTLSPSEV